MLTRSNPRINVPGSSVPVDGSLSGVPVAVTVRRLVRRLARLTELDTLCVAALVLLGVANGLGQHSAASLLFQSQLANLPWSEPPFVAALLVVVAGLGRTSVRHFGLAQWMRGVLAGTAALAFFLIVCLPYHAAVTVNGWHCAAVTAAISASTAYLLTQNVRAATVSSEGVLRRVVLAVYVTSLVLFAAVEVQHFGFDHIRALTDPASPMPLIEIPLMLTLLLAGIAAPPPADERRSAAAPLGTA